jgi:hypothetical protein
LIERRRIVIDVEGKQRYQISDLDVGLERNINMSLPGGTGEKSIRDIAE